MNLNDYEVITRVQYHNNQTKYYQLNDPSTIKKMMALISNIQQDKRILLASTYGSIDNKIHFDNQPNLSPLFPLKNIQFRFLEINEKNLYFGSYTGYYMKRPIKAQAMIAYPRSLLSQEKRDKGFPKFYRQQHPPADRQVKIEYLADDQQVKTIFN